MQDPFEEKLVQAPEYGEIIAKQTELEALSIFHLSDDDKRGFKFQIGNGILLLFLGKSEAARKTLAVAETFYKARMSERARMWILNAGLLSVAVVTASVVLALWISGVGLLYSDDLFEQVILGALAGVWGTFISLTLRASALGIDATAGAKLHYLESYCRILTGLVAGAIAVCGVSAGIVAPGLMKLGAPMLLILGFTAGFSERFLPSLVGRAESSMQGTGPQQDGPAPK